MDAIVGNPGGLDRAKEHISNLLSFFGGEPNRVRDELIQSGQSMWDIPGHLMRGDFSGAANEAHNAAVHGIYGVPLAGAAIKGVTDEVAAGRYKEAAGDILALGTQVIQPELGPKQLHPGAPKIGLNFGRNPKALEASKYLASEAGVPMNAGAATDSPFVRGGQKLAQSTPGGAYVGEAIDAEAAAKLARQAQRLTERSSPGQAMIPESAGISMDTALEGKFQGLKGAADLHYDAVRAAEAHPGNIQNVQVAWDQVPGAAPGMPPTFVPVFRDVGLPVDLRPFRNYYRTEYRRIKSLMGDAVNQYSPAFNAMRNLMENHDFVIPASALEEELGAIKTISRNKEGRAYGLAKMMTAPLQDMVDNALSQAIGDPQAHLQAARRLVSAYKDTEEFMKALKSDKSVGSFNRLVQPQDANIEMLLNAQKEAPGEMRKLGRAWLYDTFKPALGEGGFDRAKRVFNEWQNLGDTQALLFMGRQRLGGSSGAKKCGGPARGSAAAQYQRFRCHWRHLLWTTGLSPGRARPKPPPIWLPHSPEGVRLRDGRSIPTRAPGWCSTPAPHGRR
jgi:hypothetical protein